MNKTLIRLGVSMVMAMAGTAASAACYHVYNGKGQLVERGSRPPIRPPTPSSNAWYSKARRRKTSW